MIGIIAVLTMLVGCILAITQSDIKRMLAYSSIAHAGFLLTGFVGLHSVASFDGAEISSIQAVLFYLVTYGFMTRRRVRGRDRRPRRAAARPPTCPGGPVSARSPRSSRASSRSSCSPWPASR